jgi:GST-like protein
MMKFCFRPSPNPLKVALNLEETCEPDELIDIDSRKEDRQRQKKIQLQERDR